jgi:ABC-type multidrug transport system fused ATPase/permease subunit
LHRLLVTLRPYKWTLVGVFFLVVAGTGLDLLAPFLMGVAIDKFIAAGDLAGLQRLILDDSTSSVDVETEAKIQAALESLMADRTSFIIAQRISTVLNADKIVVLDGGQIAAEGTHTELMASSPIYREIYESQLGDGEAYSG